VAYVLEKEGDISAVIAESIGNNTASIPPHAYWEIIRKACDKLGALLVFDEIPTCFWRTGNMFAFEHYDVVPDMVAIGKSLGGGVFPLAAMIAREEFDVMPNRGLGHFTHEKNPVAAAASLAAIEYIEENNFAQHVLALGEYALGQMREMMTRHRLIGDVRGKGLLMVMELVRDRTTKERASEEAEIIMYRAFEKGMAFKLSMGNIIYLCPALMIKKEEMDRALHILDECLADVEKK
jgi:4-aminobutyrate aminotransferase